jgi:T5SS/PEP-CTERM-associated repeat protein
VRGQNDRLIVHDDSLTLVVPDSSLGVDYALVNSSETTPSLTIGLAALDAANVTLRGATSAASISTETTSIGRSALSSGVLTVDNLQWNGDGDLIVGETGTGTLTIQNGSEVTSNQGYLGLNYVLDHGSFGTVTVTGEGSTWYNLAQLLVGSYGTGNLTISAGGSVSNSQGYIGSFGGSMGTATVTGAGSTWNNSGELRVGADGDGELLVAAGGSVTNTNGRIGDGPDVTGAVTVTGVGATWTSSEDLFVGDAGDGTLVISRGGRVEDNEGRIGEQPGSTGIVHVSGGSTWANSNSIIVGFDGAGELTIEAGGSASSFASVWIGFRDDSSGEVTVTGAGANLATDLSVHVGQSGTGQLTISNGGSVSAALSGSVGSNAGSTGTATVTGAGSTWNVADSMSVGFLGMGTLTLQNGGTITSASGTIGRQAGATGTVTVSGLSTPGSMWELTGRLSVAGYAPTGVAGGTGTLNVGLGGTVDVAEDTVLFPNGLVRLQGGTFGTSAISFEGGGQFQWTSGTLHVGIFEGDLTAPSGGTLAPGRSAGSTTILGDYTQSTGATLEIEIGGTATATEFDFVDVTGTATLGGELQLALISDFVPDPDDEFIVFNAGDVLSFFSNAGNGQRVDTVDGIGSFLVHYGPTSAFDPDQIVLSEFLPAGVPGDYNNDGTVDTADYVVWRKTDGGQAGYNLWRANFGRTVGAASRAAPGQPGSPRLGEPTAAVPEPAGIIMLLAALLAGLNGRWPS